MKKFVCILFAVLFTFPLSLMASAEEALNDPFGYDAVCFSKVANEEYNKLVKKWNNCFPAFYAGAYIENKQLNILVTEVSDDIIDEIVNTITEVRPNIKRVDYSYSHLLDVNEKIGKIITNLDKSEKKIFVGFGIDERKNRVEIEVLKSYYNNEQKARDLVGDYPEIYFTFKDKEYTSQTDINAGCKDWLQNGSDSSVSTIACMGTRITNSGTTERGLVVAGHAGNVGDTMKINGTTIGTITKRNYSGKLDSAFVKINSTSSYTISQKLSSNYKITTYDSVGIAGSIYTMHGMTSGKVAGFVNNTSFSFIMDNINFNDMIRMKLSSAAGDSGGPLVVATSFLSKNNKIVGFLSGGDGTYSNFTKFTEFATAYNFTLV